MNQPKFRAWEPDVEFMNNQVRVTWNRFGSQELSVEVTDAFGWKTVDSKYLMQSTGLKDKNGVEIFEGDVVRVSGHPFDKNGNFNGNYEVGWDKRDLTYLAGNLLLFRLKPYIEVLGNIHENPELLNEVE